jgi:hypothetical protein
MGGIAGKSDALASSSSNGNVVVASNVVSG